MIIKVEFISNCITIWNIKVFNLEDFEKQKAPLIRDLKSLSTFNILFIETSRRQVSSRKLPIEYKNPISMVVIMKKRL